MTTPIPALQQCKPAVLCTQGQLSYEVINALLARGVVPARLVLPGIDIHAEALAQYNTLFHSGASQNPTALEIVATNHAIPICKDQLLHPDVFLKQLLDQGINLLLVACFPYKIPSLIYRSICSINLHPSLLPAYKGPSPLFWQLFYNDPHLSVSLHFLSQAWDSGKIIAQAKTRRGHGITEDQLNRQLAQLACDLLLKSLRGETIDIAPTLPGSYFRSPTATDFQIFNTWDVQHAFDFMLGTQSWNKPYRCKFDNGESIWLAKPLSVKRGERLESDYSIANGEAFIQLRHGVLVSTLSK